MSTPQTAHSPSTTTEQTERDAHIAWRDELARTYGPQWLACLYCLDSGIDGCDADGYICGVCGGSGIVTER